MAGGAGLGHAEELGEELSHLACVGVLEGEHLDLGLLGGGGVEAADDLVEEAHVLDGAGNHEGVHAWVRGDEDAFLEGGGDEFLAVLGLADELEDGLGVGVLVGERGGLGVEGGGEDGGEGLGAGVLEGEDLDLGDAGDLVGVELADDLGDAAGIGLAAGDDEGVDAFVGVDDDGEDLVGAGLAEEALDGGGDAAGVGLGEGEDVDGEAGVGGLGVELLDEGGDGVHVIDGGSDEEGVDPVVGDDGDGVDGVALHLGWAVGDDGLEGLLELGGGGLPEGEDAEVEAGEGAVAVELGEEAIDEVEGLLGAGDEEGVDAVVGEDGDGDDALVGVDGDGVGGALGAEELLEDGCEGGGAGVAEGVEADVGGGGDVLGVELLDDGLDDGEVLGGGGDDEGVGAGIDGGGEDVLRGAGIGVGVGREAGAVEALLDEGAEDGGDALGVGELEGEHLEDAAGDGGLGVELADEGLDELEVLLGGGDDEGVVEGVGLDIDLLGGERGLAGEGLGAEAGGEGGLDEVGDASGVVVAEGDDDEGEGGVLELLVQLAEEVVEGGVVVLGSGDEEDVGAGVGEDDGLLALQVGAGQGGVALGKEGVEGGGEDAGVGVLDGDDADAACEGWGGLVELLGEGLDELEALAGAADEEGVGAGVGEDDDLEGVGGSRGAEGALGDACVHEPLEGGGDEGGVGVLEGDELDVAEVEVELLVQLAEEGVEDGKGLGIAGDDEGGGAGVEGDDGLVLVAEVAGAGPGEEVGEDLLDGRGIGVLEGIDADRFEARGGGDVELAHDVLDEREHVRARGDEEDVGDVVGLEGEGGAGLGGLGGLGGVAAVAEGAEAGDLGGEALGAGDGGALGEDGAEEREQA